ncbi:hypothetical protein [Aquabacterium sp. CECT 9606]|uniref:hypothetical protein n=1 Tax=Aquabacterium sp. CECT 9606 TaxID=2845822 RepID=UPI001E3095E9|nr:hypothetical protein [Aquabacterium sp. CECT 9606]CAH0353141.1 hypothetical protein AQB9606_03082 [Aquabacterium sp. CECT 9606]
MFRSLDQSIADSVNGYLKETHPDTSEVPILEAPSTWRLCNILADFGLAQSTSTGVSTRQIGPFRLAIVEDAPRDINSLVVSVIPIALQAAVGANVLPVAGYIAALTFAFRILGATLSSGCLVEDRLEWQVLLWLKAANEESPARFPTAVETLAYVRQGSGNQATAESDVQAALGALQRKRPLWGDKQIALIQLRPAGGFQVLV